MLKMIRLIFILPLFLFVKSDSIADCFYEPHTNFDFDYISDSFIGTWYQIRVGDNLFNTPKPQSCVEETYSREPNNKYLLKYNYKGKFTNGSLIEQNGFMSIKRKREEYQSVTFNVAEDSIYSKVIGFEEGKWILWYSCLGQSHPEWGPTNYQYFSLWSKTRTLSTDVESTLTAVVSNLGLEGTFFPVFQNDCT